MGKEPTRLRRTFTPQFKKDAVRLVVEEGKAMICDSTSTRPPRFELPEAQQAQNHAPPQIGAKRPDKQRTSERLR